MQFYLHRQTCQTKTALVMYIKASAAVRIVSAIIRSRGRISTYTCIVSGENFRGVYGHDESRSLEMNLVVPPNKTLELLFEVEEFDMFYCSPCKGINNMITKDSQRTRDKTGEHQFTTRTKLGHANISIDCEGMRLVDSLNIMVLY